MLWCADQSHAPTMRMKMLEYQILNVNNVSQTVRAKLNHKKCRRNKGGKIIEVIIEEWKVEVIDKRKE